MPVMLMLEEFAYPRLILFVASVWGECLLSNCERWIGLYSNQRVLHQRSDVSCLTRVDGKINQIDAEYGQGNRKETSLLNGVSRTFCVRRYIRLPILTLG